MLEGQEHDPPLPFRTIVGKGLTGTAVGATPILAILL